MGKFGKFFRGFLSTVDPILGAAVNGITHDAEREGGFFGHNGTLSNFWHDKVEPYSTDLYNSITGKTDREFAREQADLQFERQKWLISNQPQMEADALAKAGYSLAAGNPGTNVSTPQMAQANRISPGLGEINGLVNGVLSNVMAFRQQNSDLQTAESQRALLDKQSGVMSAQSSYISELTGMTKNQSSQIVELTKLATQQIAALKNDMEFKDAQKPLFKANAYKAMQEAFTESFKRRNLSTQSDVNESMLDVNGALANKYRQDTKTSRAQMFNYNASSRVLNYNLRHILPLTAQEIGSRIGLNKEQSDYMAQSTVNLIQAYWLKQPEAAWIIKHIEEAKKYVGAQKLDQYYESLDNMLNAKIHYNRSLRFRPAEPGHDPLSWMYYNTVIRSSSIAEDMAMPIAPILKAVAK